MHWHNYKLFPALIGTLVFLSMAFSTLVHASIDVSTSHDTVKHAVFFTETEEHGSNEREEHGHSHEISIPPGGDFNHSHEHNPADHTHEVPGVVGYRGQSSTLIPEKWQSAVTIDQDDYLLFGIMRPPRL